MLSASSLQDACEKKSPPKVRNIKDAVVVPKKGSFFLFFVWGGGYPDGRVGSFLFVLVSRFRKSLWGFDRV